MSKAFSKKALHWKPTVDHTTACVCLWASMGSPPSLPLFPALFSSSFHNTLRIALQSNNILFLNSQAAYQQETVWVLAQSEFSDKSDWHNVYVISILVCCCFKTTKSVDFLALLGCMMWDAGYGPRPITWIHLRTPLCSVLNIRCYTNTFLSCICVSFTAHIVSKHTCLLCVGEIRNTTGLSESNTTVYKQLIGLVELLSWINVVLHKHSDRCLVCSVLTEGSCCCSPGFSGIHVEGVWIWLCVTHI